MLTSGATYSSGRALFLVAGCGCCWLSFWTVAFMCLILWLLFLRRENASQALSHAQLCANVDVDFFRFRFFRLRQDHAQNPIFVLGFDFIGRDRRRKAHRALKSPEETLGAINFRILI